MDVVKKAGYDTAFAFIVPNAHGTPEEGRQRGSGSGRLMTRAFNRLLALGAGAGRIRSSRLQEPFRRFW